MKVIIWSLVGLALGCGNPLQNQSDQALDQTPSQGHTRAPITALAQLRIDRETLVSQSLDVSNFERIVLYRNDPPVCTYTCNDADDRGTLLRAKENAKFELPWLPYGSYRLDYDNQIEFADHLGGDVMFFVAGGIGYKSTDFDPRQGVDLPVSGTQMVVSLEAPRSVSGPLDVSSCFDGTNPRYLSLLRDGTSDPGEAHSVGPGSGDTDDNLQPIVVSGTLESCQPYELQVVGIPF